MTLRNTFIALTILTICACTEMPKHDKSFLTKQESKSKVLSFQYSGYDDNSYAIIYGDVYQSDTTKHFADSLQPLSNVIIKAEQNGKTVSSDTGGHFKIELEKGMFTLLITKQEYQSIRLTNYVSDPDQLSFTKIILAKGNGLQSFKIPDRKE
jgi:hypothetical protein